MADVPKCPVHGIPGCSPLLNGCTWRPVPTPELGSAEPSYVDGFDVNERGHVLDGSAPLITWTYTGPVQSRAAGELADLMIEHQWPGEVLTGLGDCWATCGCGERIDITTDGEVIRSEDVRAAYRAHLVAVFETPAGGRAPVDGDDAPDGSEPTSPPAGPTAESAGVDECPTGGHLLAECTSRCTTEKAQIWFFGDEAACRYLASVSWPWEREENRDAWAVTMLHRPDLLAREIEAARERLESAIAALSGYCFPSGPVGAS